MSRTSDGRAPVQPWGTWVELRHPLAHKYSNIFQFTNDVYVVTLEYMNPVIGAAGSIHVSISRKDRSHVRDWRHLQRIKNEIVGEEREAVEVFPAESRLHDTVNQFHLWVAPAGHQWATGYAGRSVGTAAAAAALGGSQRPWDDGATPPDALVDMTEIHERERADVIPPSYRMFDPRLFRDAIATEGMGRAEPLTDEEWQTFTRALGFDGVPRKVTFTWTNGEMRCVYEEDAQAARITPEMFPPLSITREMFEAMSAWFAALDMRSEEIPMTEEREL